MTKYHDALDDLLERPIAFNPSFKKITGSSNAAILLSQGFYWTKRTTDPDGWFYKTRVEWMSETGLTEEELDGAREKCRAVGVMEEKLKGVPATLHYRVVKAKVYELLGVQIPENPQSEIPENPQSSFQGIGQIGGKQESGKTGNFNNESETTSETTTNMPDFPVSIEWELAHGRQVAQPQLDEAKLRDKALKMFEAAFGFGKLPWDSTSVWERFSKFVIEIYRGDPFAFGKYVVWRASEDGKFKAMNNKQIRMNPQTFMDTSWPEFEATQEPSTSNMSLLDRALADFRSSHG